MRQSSRRHEVAEDETPTGLIAFFSRRRVGLGVIFVVAAAATIGVMAWQRFGPDVRQQSDYLLKPNDIVLVGQPAWVKGDIKAEALRDASLDGILPLDDPELARRLARAFDVHPWVRSVDRVEVLSPASAHITISCREPLAMVRVPGGLLPVDREAFVLPSEDFTSEEARGYPIISGVSSLPQGPAGSAWGDQAIEEAVAVVDVTLPEWPPLDLTECQLVVEAGRRSWELVNTAGVAIRFGSSPRYEQSGEPDLAEKVRALKQLAESGPVTMPTELGQQSPTSVPLGGEPVTDSVDAECPSPTPP
jgi:hypothetical protein